MLNPINFVRVVCVVVSSIIILFCISRLLFSMGEKLQCLEHNIQGEG